MKKLICFLAFFIGLKAFSQQAMHIYSGESHDIYLGCLNCNTNNPNSIWNEYGTYGNHYNAKSIWNNYGS